METGNQSITRGPLDGVVRVEALYQYSVFVEELGGDSAALLAQEGIDPEALCHPEAVISYRSMIHLLENSAEELNCPDFGLRLALRQGGIPVLGPLQVAMRNSTTVGEAYRYCAGHLQVYSPVVHIQIEREKNAQRHYMRFEILLSRVPQQRQAVENALGLTHLAVLALSHGKFGVREVWFTHERIASLASYQRHFNAPVRFGMPFNAVYFNDSDLAEPILDQDPQLYEIASGYIDSHFPEPELHLATRVRVAAKRLLPLGLCTLEEVAGRLYMHPRTLQRRLKEEGTSFDAVRDAVRMDAAYRYLGQPSMPLTRVATLLGYSETSVLSRSCYRWFSCSPKQMRKDLVQ